MDAQEMGGCPLPTVPRAGLWNVLFCVPLLAHFLSSASPFAVILEAQNNTLS